MANETFSPTSNNRAGAPMGGVASDDSTTQIVLRLDPTSKRLLVDAIADITPGSNLEGGGKIAVGTTAVEVTFTGTTNVIIITADGENTGTLYVGKSNVTSAGANAIAYLNAGQRLIVDYDDASNAVYVVGSAASQNFWKGAVL